MMINNKELENTQKKIMKLTDKINLANREEKEPLLKELSELECFRGCINAKLETQKQKWIKEYNCLPVNSKKFDRKIKKYKIVYSVEKKKGKNHLFLTLIKQIGKNKNYFDKVKKICLEEF